ARGAGHWAPPPDHHPPGPRAGRPLRPALPPRSPHDRDGAPPPRTLHLGSRKGELEGGTRRARSLKRDLAAERPLHHQAPQLETQAEAAARTIPTRGVSLLEQRGNAIWGQPIAI